jgi:methylmalonyl-CoA/ethylmalonyl-CoA epimerase
MTGFRFVDHVAIAVRPGELEAQVGAYTLLGFTEIHREEVGGGDKVREVLLQIGDGPNLIQLLEPTAPDSPVQKLIDRNGGRGGFAHIAYRVDDIQRAFDDMKARGFQIIDKAPRKGSRGTTVFFVHPKSREQGAFGLLVEVVQEG